MLKIEQKIGITVLIVTGTKKGLILIAESTFVPHDCSDTIGEVKRLKRRE